MSISSGGDLMAAWIALAFFACAFAVCLYAALIEGSDDDDKWGHG